MLRKMYKAVRPDGIVAFRILFGAIMLWEVYRYFDSGWIHRYWIEPIFNFKYGGFFWVEPLPGDGMVWLFYLLGLLSIFIMIGFLYRFSTVLFFLVFTYTFLLEQARYLNHFYLVILISFLLIFIPAHRSFSVDAWLFPKIRKSWIPSWSLWLLRFQIGLVYFFGGIAKLNPDWLSGSPMDLWLPRRSDFPLVGSYFDQSEVIMFVSYSGLFLDLLALPLLLIRKTRPWIALALVVFHLTNDRLFSIGIFPWFMIGALVLYLPASWPRQFLWYLRSLSLVQQSALLISVMLGGYIAIWFHQDLSLVPLLCGCGIAALLFWDLHRNSRDIISRRNSNVPSHARFTVAALSVWFLLQVIIPLRHFAIPGNPNWTEEGHRFAWHMKLRTKDCDLQFYIADSDTSQKEALNPANYLRDWQYSDMEGRPQLIAQYAKILSSIYDHKPIYADVECSLNGGPVLKLIDPDVDLTQVRFKDWKRNDWIYIY